MQIYACTECAVKNKPFSGSAILDWRRIGYRRRKFNPLT